MQSFIYDILINESQPKDSRAINAFISLYRYHVL